MATHIKKSKPTSPGRRFRSWVSRDDLHKGDPYAPLLEAKKQKSGRNNQGRITTRHRGGGHKKHYRIIDFKRLKDGIPAKVETIEYDPNRSANIALLLYADGERTYIIAPDGLRVGDAPQTQFGGRAIWQFTDAIDFGATYIYNDRLYASYDPTDYENEADKVQPFQLDSYGQLDLRVGFKTGDNGYFQIHCFNALDYQGFIEAVDNGLGTDIQEGWTNTGRNFSFSYRVKF